MVERKFFNLVAFSDKDTVSDYLSLNVSNKINVVPDMNINLTRLNRGEETFNHFFSNGYAGITFKLTVIIRHKQYFDENGNKTLSDGVLVNMNNYTEDQFVGTTDMWNGKPVIEVLQDWFANMTPLDVVTSAIDIPDGEYIITKNPSRQQSSHNQTKWELEFTSYTPLTLAKYENNNANVLAAINKAKTANKNAINKKLKKCNYKVLKYSKKRKYVKCVDYMQQILYKKGFLKKKYIDGWFGKETKSAVKKFQKKYNKKKLQSKSLTGYATAGTLINSSNVNMDYLDTSDPAVKNALKVKTKSSVTKVLQTNGKVDKATWKALCEA